jgi:hypothetical protein
VKTLAGSTWRPQRLAWGIEALTWFDDEVIDVFSPPAAEARYLFITVFGLRRRAAPS